MKPDTVVGEVTGEIGKDGNVLVIRRIHVSYRIKGIPKDKRDAVERVREMHAEFCPVARTIGKCVQIRTDVTYL